MAGNLAGIIILNVMGNVRIVQHFSFMLYVLVLAIRIATMATIRIVPHFNWVTLNSRSL